MYQLKYHFLGKPYLTPCKKQCYLHSNKTHEGTFQNGWAQLKELDKGWGALMYLGSEQEPEAIASAELD